MDPYRTSAGNISTLRGMRVSTSHVRINAPRERVWAVLTDPELVRQWQYGSNVDTDWAAGSPIRFTSEWQGKRFEQWGTVLDVTAPEQLRYSLFAPRPDVEDRPENYFTMTYRLDTENGITLLTITQEDPREQPGQGPDQQDEDNPVLAALKAVADCAPSSD